ncbi:MAG: undecaprenyl-diphosphate phosphatase [Gammaproteobacteria bacterium]|nr:undecaprenyl-diphosphate phosphatase [Gammaproteobacteria bacterium]
MDFTQILVLALVQGLTEFLPISSSAHLILIPVVAGWQDQGLAFDVAVHVGTLGAVVFYFRQELVTLSVDWSRSIAQRQAVGDSLLAWAVIIATIPAVVAGFLFKDYVETVLRSPIIIAATTIGFGLLLLFADKFGRRIRNEHSLGLYDILIIGFAQALALVPGTSRSGITITAGLLLGMTREASARFSFLLSIPIIAGGGLLKTKDLVESSQLVDWGSILLGIALSGGTAYLCIHYFMKLLDRIGMAPFVAYRLFLGALLLVLFL